VYPDRGVPALKSNFKSIGAARACVSDGFTSLEGADCARVTPGAAKQIMAVDRRAERLPMVFMDWLFPWIIDVAAA
jgi:hypothetical protein